MISYHSLVGLWINIVVVGGTHKNMNICSICTFNFRALPRQRLINFQSTLCWLLQLHYCAWIVVVYCNKSCSTETSWHPNMNIVFVGEYCRTICTSNIHRDIITQHLNWLAPFGNNFGVVLLKISSLNSAEEWKVSGDNKVWENSQICINKVFLEDVAKEWEVQSKKQIDGICQAPDYIVTKGICTGN